MGTAKYKISNWKQYNTSISKPWFSDILDRRL